MSRYRKIEVGTWSDEKFRALSPIPPCAQGLWFFLLTGPFTGSIPGLYRAGRAAMAEELGWETEDFNRVFQELVDRGMVKADFKARLVWIPNALRYNHPTSTNVVRSWRGELSTLPDCELRTEAMASVEAYFEASGGGMPEAWLEVCGKSKPRPSTNPSGKGKEQTPTEALPEGKTDAFGPPIGDAATEDKTDPVAVAVAETGTGTGTVKNGAQARATLGPADGLDLKEQVTNVVRAVIEDTKISNLWATSEMEKQAEMELKKFPGQMDKVRALMGRAWEVYLQCAKKGKLRSPPMGAQKFFGDGIWRTPAMWGLKKGMKAYEEAPVGTAV